ncbi:MAG TPA: hypothetical protein VKX16_10375 [Chloroflexota bacterium]|nr:hypothetical protein [Chloroflexota bacterium]
MTISNPTNALTKQVTEDSINGLPVRLCDQNGNFLNTATRTIVVPSAAYTANGTSATQQPPPSASELLFLLRLSAVSGTTPTLNVYVDVSDDGGTTWFQAAQLGPSNIAAAPANNPYPSTYLLTMSPGNANGSWGDTYRIRWVITGTTPSYTFQVTQIAKQL